MSSSSFASSEQSEALALLDRLFGSSPSSTASFLISEPSHVDEIRNWRESHHHRSSSLSSTSSTDSYWQGRYLSVPDTPIDRNEEYPFDLSEPPQANTLNEYKGPKITVSPVENVQTRPRYLSRGGKPSTADKPTTSWNEGSSMLPSITVEFAD